MNLLSGFRIGEQDRNCKRRYWKFYGSEHGMEVAPIPSSSKRLQSLGIGP